MKVFWLSLLWAFTTNACWAESFNIWGGSPIGGFGDVATNLLLAQQLKEVRPKADITIVYSEEAGSEYLGKLIPGFKSSAKAQSFGGIRFVRSDTPIPRADYFFEFSAKNGKYDDLAPVPEKIAASGKVLMRFSELGTNEHTDPTQKNTSAVSPLIANDSTASQIRLRLLTGPAVNEAGLYLSSSKPSARLTRPELFQKLSALDKSGNPCKCRISCGLSRLCKIWVKFMC